MKVRDKINDLELFLKIVEAGSLTRAAVMLDSSLPSMSRRLAQIEQRLGVKLIDRNARRFKLTEKGKYFLEHTQQILALVEHMESHLQDEQEFLTGQLRVASLIQFGKKHLANWIAEFAQQYPHLNIELILSDSKVDLIEDELDFSFQIEMPTASDLCAITLVQGKKIYCASPEYLQKFGMPQHPKDLVHHHCLCLIRNRHIFNEWTFQEADNVIHMKVLPQLASDSSEIVHQWVLNGLGIAYKLNWDIQADLSSGKIIECLAEFNPAHKNLYLVYQANKATQAKHQSFLNFIKEKFEQVNAS